MMDILMSETCWTHKKRNKNSKWHQVGLLFSTIKMMHGPVNTRFIKFGIFVYDSGLVAIAFSTQFREQLHVNIATLWLLRCFHLPVVFTYLFVYLKCFMHWICRRMRWTQRQSSRSKVSPHFIIRMCREKVRRKYRLESGLLIRSSVRREFSDPLSRVRRISVN
jgi:hypothetical protein